MKKRILTIDRSKWLNGSVLLAAPRIVSRLRNKPTGLQCCLGFGLRELCGLTAGIITEGVFPSSIRNLVQVTEPFDVLEAMEDDASYINDDRSFTPKFRERALIRLFAKNGITLKFTGSTEDAITKAQKVYRNADR